MADPLLSVNEYVCTGTQTEFEISFAGGYISQDHVKVFVGDSVDASGNLVNPEALAFTWVNDYTVSITPAPAVDKILRIYRDTPFNAPIVDFTDQSVLSEDTLDTNAKQAVFLAAELRDRFGSAIDPTLMGDFVRRAEEAAEAAEAAADGLFDFQELLSSEDGAEQIGLAQGGTVQDAITDYTPQMFGAIADFTSHPVAEWIIPGVRGRYASLAALQVDYPHVTSTTDEIDWAATQKALTVSSADIGGGNLQVTPVYMPAGRYMLNQYLLLPVGVQLRGAGGKLEGLNRNNTRLYATNNNDIFRVDGFLQGAYYYWHGQVTDLSMQGHRPGVVLPGTTGFGFHAKTANDDPVIMTDQTLFLDLTFRFMPQGGMMFPNGALPLYIGRCKFLWNGGPGITCNRISQFQGVTFDNISGDGNIGGIIRLFQMSANDNFTIINLRAERRSMPIEPLTGLPVYGGVSAGGQQPNPIVVSDSSGIGPGITILGGNSISSVTANLTWVGSISGDVMTVTSGDTPYIGADVTGTGVAAGTTVIEDLGGGTYRVDVSQTVPAGTTITTTNRWIKPGDFISVSGSNPRLSWFGLVTRVRTYDVSDDPGDPTKDPRIVGGSGAFFPPDYTVASGFLSSSLPLVRSRLLLHRDTVSGATPSALGRNVMLVDNSTATNMTNITDPEEGQVMVLAFNNSNTTVVHGASTINLATGANWTPGGNSTLSLIYTGGKWRETARSYGVTTGTYSVSNLTTDRTFDANRGAFTAGASYTQAQVQTLSDTVSELADILGTLIRDLTERGII